MGFSFLAYFSTFYACTGVQSEVFCSSDLVEFVLFLKAKKNELCLFPVLALCAKRISADHARKGKKRKARGRKKRNAPRNELLIFIRFLKRRAERRSLKCFSLRAEEDTEPRK